MLLKLLYGESFKLLQLLGISYTKPLKIETRVTEDS